MRYDTLQYLWTDDAADGAPASRAVLLTGGEALPAADGAAPPEYLDAAQILRDRPDVYAAFYREYYGPNNDRNSDAWVDRVGGATPEDYALYWYKNYAFFEGYTQAGGGGGQGAPAEDAGFQGRTTLDGVPIAKILSDRPDVFQAFFTEYYGAGNDRNSDAWVQRVGGTTVEDYANYWYNAHGKIAGYVPSAPPPAAPTDGPPPEPTNPTPTDEPAPVVEADPPVAAADPPADPFIYSDPEAPMLPLGAGQSLFDPDPFAA